MTDRQPTKPNRYAVYDDDHNFIRYEYHERADEPTQVGDALNKANLLPDAVATALGLTDNPQVKDALTKLFDIANPKAKIATGSYTGTGTYGYSDKNSLTLEFEPKFIVAFTAGDKTNIIPLIMIKPSTQYKVSIFSAHYGGDVMWSANNVSWWSSRNDGEQYNSSGKTYYYAAIG